MAERGAGAALAQESLTPVAWRVERRAHHLDGDLVAEQRSHGPIHLAHAAGAQLAGDFVAPVEKGAGFEHVWAYKVLGTGPEFKGARGESRAARSDVRQLGLCPFEEMLEPEVGDLLLDRVLAGAGLQVRGVDAIEILTL